MGMFVLNLILQFISRGIFLQYLGTEILGLNTTSTNILQFLNLAELGVWSAVATSLYKPLHERNEYEICRLSTFNRVLYRRIGLFIIVCSIVVMAFFPLIFSKMELPLYYAYLSFGALLFSSLLGYFINYRQFVLIADQQNYKVQYTLRLSQSMKFVAQMLAMVFLPYPFFTWLILEVVFSTLGAISLEQVVRKTYPFLHPTGDTFASLKKSYPEILTKTKQLFIQKVATFVIVQTSPLIIYGFSTLTLVTLYNNYTLISFGLISLMNAIFNGMLSGIGNLVISSSQQHILDVFAQLYSIRFLLISALSFGMFVCAQPFICVWIGCEYLLPISTLAILTFTFFIYSNRTIVTDFLTAYGYFSDVWASIVEILVNIGLSVGLGFIFGLNGILSGVVISLILISVLWKPLFLFKIKLRNGFGAFWKDSLKMSSLIIISMAIILLPFHILSPKVDSNTAKLLWGLVATLVFTVISILLFYVCHAPFRRVMARFGLK